MLAKLKLKLGLGARIHCIPANGQGRDLIVGDLHGYRRTLDTALKNLRFNPQHDRLISVGDLVDRGPDSIGCLRLLREPWFLAVMGNHEDLMLGAVQEYTTGRGGGHRFAAHHDNGGDWLLEAWPPDEELQELVTLTQGLPHLLVVGEGDNRYHVAHAGLPDGITDKTIDRGFISDPAGLLWRRSLGNALRQLKESQELPGPSPADLSTTYCGHVICADEQGLPLRGFGHVNLETGVAAGGVLTIAVRDPDGREAIHQQAPRG
ncbi:metallophosphoesterase [Aquisalimonas sp.]|uniref:metallophosphoesterase n=1 Tax=Aquisalimonas sp. TaxID=1872621 RepID=UPI0025BE8C86|nr:metallophosphoesterase [Aquisalimonas sp.]